MNEQSFSPKWADWFWQIRLELKLTYAQFCILYALFTYDNACMQQHLIKGAQICLEDSLSLTNDRYDIYPKQTISLNEWKSAIDELEKKKIIFCCSDTDIQMLTSFFSWNAIEFVSPRFPRIGEYYPTYAGTILGNRIIETHHSYNSCILHNCCHNKNVTFFPFFSNKNGKIEHYILSDDEDGIELGQEEQNKFDNYFQFGTTFSIGTWCEHVWNVHPHGLACKIILPEELVQ
ncbi:MAG: hypothetical protein LBE12_13915 [Planctomycetaceae bacterium]|jgi:hypothetical protein|nr:hypothetical protein [Planctomycetaceae bacterium]